MQMQMQRSERWGGRGQGQEGQGGWQRRHLMSHISQHASSVGGGRGISTA